ncbi:MAG: hypothetical protein ACRYGR_00550, partial [Janthinobacterium lividum]
RETDFDDGGQESEEEISIQSTLLKLLAVVPIPEVAQQDIQRGKVPCVVILRLPGGKVSFGQA